MELIFLFQEFLRVELWDHSWKGFCNKLHICWRAVNGCYFWSLWFCTIQAFWLVLPAFPKSKLPQKQSLCIPSLSFDSQMQHSVQKSDHRCSFNEFKSYIELYYGTSIDLVWMHIDQFLKEIKKILMSKYAKVNSYFYESLFYVL